MTDQARRRRSSAGLRLVSPRFQFTQVLGVFDVFGPAGPGSTAWSFNGLNRLSMSMAAEHPLDLVGGDGDHFEPLALLVVAVEPVDGGHAAKP